MLFIIQSHLWSSTGIQGKLQSAADMSHGHVRGALLPCDPCNLVSGVELGVLLQAGKEPPHGVRSLLGLAPSLVHALQN